MIIKKQIPPKSIRYCLICDKETTYKYNPTITHSCCVKCGNRFGVNIDNNVLIHFKKKLSKLQNHNCKEQLNKKINNQRIVINRLTDQVRLLNEQLRNLKIKGGK